MANLDNVRISLKIDDLSNWNSNSSIVLNDGEVALIRCPNGLIKTKIGNGKTEISNLNYINENVETLNQGILNIVDDKNLVAGFKLSALGDFQSVFGFNAEALSTDTFSFIWNGSSVYNYNDRYKSHGSGSFQVNPENGLSGFWIGEQNMSQLLDKLYIDSKKVESLSIEHISQDYYHELVATDSVISNVLYIVSSDNLNAYGEQIKNVADGIDLSDAVNLNQLCSAISSIDIPEIPTKVSVFENDANYTKLSVDQIPITNFNIKHISQNEYHNEVINGVDSNTLYIVSSDTLNMYGESIQNLADPINETDATNKQYVDSISLFLSNDYQQKIDQNNIIFDNKINIISNTIDNKITIDSISSQSIDIKHISQDDYHELVAADSVLSNTLYIVSSDNLNAYGEKITNVLSGIDSTDAATFGQVKQLSSDLLSEINKIEIPSNISELSNDVGFITANIDDIQVSSINIKHISQNDYHELVATSNILSDTLYIVSSDNLNAYGERIENVAEPLSANDATNKAYVDKVYSEVIDMVSRYPLILAEMDEIDGQLTYKIIDHSITTIEITDENKPIVLTLPDKNKNNYARDFILRVEIKSSVAPMFTFVGLDDSWFVESDNEEWMIMEPGVNIISFTETKA